MQGDRQLDDPEAGPEVATLLGYDVDVALAGRVDDRLQLALLQPTEVGGIFDAVQQGHSVRSLRVVPSRGRGLCDQRR